MSRPREGRVVRALLNYGMGSYLPQVINFLLVPLYTHYIAPTQMGVLEVCLTAQLLIVIIMRLGMAGSVTRFYFEHREGQDLRDLVTTVAIAIQAVAVLLTVLALFLLPSVFARYLHDVPFHPYMDIALATSFFQAAPDLQRRLFEAREQSGASARLSVAFGALTTVSNLVLVMVFRLGALGVLWANLGTAIVFALVAIVNNRKDLTGRFRMARLREALHYGLPLVPHHAAAWAQAFVGRWVLTATTTAAAVGHLAAASKIASPLAILTGAFSSAFSPVYFSWRSDLSRDAAVAETRRVGRTVVSLGAVAVIGAATAGALVVRYAMSPAYHDAARLVGVIAFALFLHLTYTLVTAEIFFSKRTRWVSIIFVVASVVNFGLVAVLAPRLGALGAAFAQLAGGAVSVLMVTLLARRSFPSPLEARAMLIAILGAAAACAFTLRSPALRPAIDVGLHLGVGALLGVGVLLATGAWTQLRADVGRLRRGRSAPAAPAPEAG
jgi:O-antigen/teichoic acid export membrane protein